MSMENGVHAPLSFQSETPCMADKTLNMQQNRLYADSSIANANINHLFPADVVISPDFHHTENHAAPPDVTSYTKNTSSSTTSDGIHVERAPGAGTAAQKQTPKYGNAELMETGDGESSFHHRSLECIIS